MISLRKHIDSYRERPNEAGVPESVLSEFSTMLLAIGESVDRAVPSLSGELNQKMNWLQKSLTQPVTTEHLTQTNLQARNELSQWSDRALSHHQEIERELREIVSVVSQTAEAFCQRDEKYMKEIGDLTGRLGSITEEKDLARVRRSIVECTHALKDFVGRLAEDSKASVQRLTGQVEEYRSRLEESERVSRTDSLTNLANRRAFENHLDVRVAAGQTFCLIMIDLNDFKTVNDRYGHGAGDDLLRQFAGELKAQFTPVDLVGRLGGDEFVVVTSGDISSVQNKVERVSTWAFGEYKIAQGDQIVKTQLSGSMGVAVWNGKETGIELLARVDQEVYRGKPSSRNSRESNSERRNMAK